MTDTKPIPAKAEAPKPKRVPAGRVKMEYIHRTYPEDVTPEIFYQGTKAPEVQVLSVRRHSYDPVTDWEYVLIWR